MERSFLPSCDQRERPSRSIVWSAHFLGSHPVRHLRRARQGLRCSTIRTRPGQQFRGASYRLPCRHSCRHVCGKSGASIRKHAGCPSFAPQELQSLQLCRMRISRGWFAWALLAGTLYVIIGVGFAPLSVPSVFFWRLAAWMVSAVVYAAHIGYEHFRIRSSPRSTALHVAFGAAVGAFGLAAAAIGHSLVTGTGSLRLLRIALLIWPLITGVPAFLVALVLTAVLARVPRCRPARPGR
jgi:hypothetical protein